MHRTRSLFVSVTRVAARSAAPLLPLGRVVARPLSVFASGDPPSSESYKTIMKELGNATNAEEMRDAQVPLGAPKPSALNRLRTSGRLPSAELLEKKRDDAQDKLARAQEYKEKRDAQRKAAAVAAKKA